MELHNTEEKISRVVIAGIHTGNRPEIDDCTEKSLDELELLVQTAGAQCVGRFVQNRPGFEPGTYIGEGKANEIRLFCHDNDVDIAVFDDELTGTQIRNLEELLKVRVMDRSSLILDIFAQRAKTSEGKLQVELAQLRYYLSRLTGSFVRLSRLGGGIGTRGPGETKLETDRRHIRNKISILKSQLDEVEKNRATQRKKRVKDGILQIAVVGYTNAGKSTLLNYLTDAGVLAEDKLFATLDPTSRKLTLPDGTNAVLTDTVGFIRKLPHHLINAFKSTLEEAVNADVLIHVVDVTADDMTDNMEVAEKLLSQLGADGKPIVTVFNKCDGNVPDITPRRENSVFISAKTGKNVDRLMQLVTEVSPNLRSRITVVIPYSEGNLLPLIHNEAHIVSEQHTESGTMLEIIADDKLKGMVSDYIIQL